MNPWREKLGCEVNVCQAKQCDAGRLEICALRRAWQQRVAWLKLKRNKLKGFPVAVRRIDKELRGMGVKSEEVMERGSDGEKK